MKVLPLLLLLLLLAAPLAAQPVFETTALDLGALPHGTTVERAFAFTNTGLAPLQVTEVNASCGCTVAAYPEAPIAPGATERISVVFEADGSMGRFHESVWVTMAPATVALGASDAAEPIRARLTLSGRVVLAGVEQGGLRIDADAVDFGTVTAGEVLRHTVDVQRNASGPIRFLSATSVPEGVEVVLPMLPLHRDEVVPIEIVIPAELVRPGSLGVAVLLETDDAVQPVKSLYLEAEVE